MVRTLISLSLIGALLLVVGCSKPDESASTDTTATGTTAASAGSDNGSLPPPTTAPGTPTAKAPGATGNVPQAQGIHPGDVQRNPNGVSAEAGTALKGR